MAVSNIITEEYQARINDALKNLEQGGKEIDLAMRAGLHKLQGGEAIATLKEKYQQAKDELTAIKNVYFPNT